jgi:hypothetical protein
MGSFGSRLHSRTLIRPNGFTPSPNMLFTVTTFLPPLSPSRLNTSRDSTQLLSATGATRAQYQAGEEVEWASLLTAQ